MRGVLDRKKNGGNHRASGPLLTDLFLALWNPSNGGRRFHHPLSPPLRSLLQLLLPFNSPPPLSLCFRSQFPPRELGFRFSLHITTFLSFPLLWSWSFSAMESISVPCPKCPVVAPRGAWPHQPRPMILVPRPQTPLLAGSARFTSVKVSSFSWLLWSGAPLLLALLPWLREMDERSVF